LRRNFGGGGRKPRHFDLWVWLGRSVPSFRTPILYFHYDYSCVVCCELNNDFSDLYLFDFIIWAEPLLSRYFGSFLHTS